ncbi:hypothetical protein ACFLXI_10285, partial [Chloroflexota bacterium]
MLTRKPLRNILVLLGILSAFWWSGQAAAKNSAISALAVTDSSPVIGLPFTISQGTINETFPAVAYNPVDREYLVVWHNVRAVDDDIYAQRISEQGKLLSSFTVAKGNYPRVAFNPENNTYLVVYQTYKQGDYDVYGQRVNFRGLIGSEFPIAFNLKQTEHHPVVAYNTHPNHDEFLVVWVNDISIPVTKNNVEGWRVKGTQDKVNPIQTIGSRLAIADNNNYNFDPDVAYNLNMNEYMVVYTRQPGGGGSYDVYGRRVTWDGGLLPET